MVTRKKKTLGDDPLSWLKGNPDADNKPVSKEKTVIKKKAKKTSPKKKEQDTKKNNADKTESNKDVIKLDQIMVIDEAEQFYNKLDNHLLSEKEILIDGSAVNMIDTAMLQLLTVFVIELKNKKIKITWKNPSEELIYRATLLDLHKQLDLG